MFKVAAPQLPPQLSTTQQVYVVDDTTLEGCLVQQADYTGVSARAVSLNSVSLVHVVLDEAILPKLSTLDTAFIRCGLSAAQCSEASLQRVLFDNSRMSGWDCSNGTCKDVTFMQCKLDMTNFRFTKLTRVQFVGCVLTDADFLGAELQSVRFEDCLLERTEFSRAKLKDVDLRTSQLIDLKGWQYLKGATIDNVQLLSAAPYLAQEIGIIVTD